MLGFSFCIARGVRDSTLSVQDTSLSSTANQVTMNLHYSLHFFITPTGQKIEYARIGRKMGRTWVGQTVSLSRLDSNLLIKIRSQA